MKQDNRLQFIHIRQINQNNVNEIYQKQFNRFLFDYSDEVNIDGKIYSNTGYDKMMRINLGYLKNEKGEPNFKKIYANGIKDGFKLTENDFVENELEQIVDYTPKGLTEKKQLKTYKEYLEKRLSELLLLNKNEPQQETKTDAPTKKEYNSSQFNDHTYKLFCHIVDEYKKDGNIKFINIWYFLKRDIDKTKYKNILFNFTQKKYKEFVKKYDVEIKKFKKADFKYKDDEVGILQNITNDYYTSLKEIENT